MAYSLEMASECSASGCTKRATHKVFAYRNEPFGQFCKKHADERVRDLTAAEAKNPAGFGR